MDLISESTDVALRAVANCAKQCMPGIVSGSVEVHITTEALRNISAKVKFFAHSASASPEREQFFEHHAHYSPARTGSINSDGNDEKPLKKKSSSGGLMSTIFGTKKKKSATTLKGHSSMSPAASPPNASGHPIAERDLSPDSARRRREELESMAEGMPLELAVEVVAYMFQQAKSVTVIGKGPDSVMGIDMSALPDGSSSLVGSLKQTKRAVYQQYETTIDMREFKTVSKLTLKNCRVILLKGVASVTELVLLRSTILLPPSEVTKARETSTQKLQQEPEQQRGRSDSEEPDPTLPSNDGLMSATSSAAPSPSPSVPQGAAASALSWDGFTNLALLKCYDCNAPLYPIPQDGIAMASQRIRHLELQRSTDESSFVFLRPLEAFAQVAAYWQLLTEIDLSENRIERLDASWSLLTELQKVNLAENCIQRLDECLRSCEKLHHVNLRANRLVDISNASACFPNVRHLDLSQNELLSVIGLSKLAKMEHLAINSNKLAFWSDMKLLAENSHALHSLTFIDNPMCLFVYRDDIGKLASSLFWSKKGMRINGLNPPTLSLAQKIDIFKKYEHVFKESSIIGASTTTGNPSPPASSARPSPRRIHSDPVAPADGPIRNNGGSNRSIEEKPHHSKRKLVKKRVKKTTVVGGDEEKESVPEENAYAFRERQQSAIAVDELTGDVADAAFLKAKYGSHWLEIYRKLVPAPASKAPHDTDGRPRSHSLSTSPHNRHRGMNSTRSDLSLEDGSLESSAHESTLRVATPEPLPPPKPTHYEPLSPEDFKRVTNPALNKFIQKLIDNDCKVWRSAEEGLPLYPNGVTWHTIELKPATEELDESSNEEDINSSISNPLMRYHGANIWQSPSTTKPDGKPIPEVWLMPDDDKVPLAPSRYDNKCLMRVDQFEYEHGVGFVIRLKDIGDVEEVASFPKPALTSMHYCPEKIGRTQYANELEFSNVHIYGEKKPSDVGDVVSYTKAQLFNLTSCFSEPTPPTMICGFVLPTREVARLLLRKIHKKFEDFRNPHYIPSPADWPLYQEPELSVEVPHLYNTTDPIEVRKSDEDSFLWSLVKEVDLSGDAHTMAKQRIGTDLRVQVDEMAMYLSSQLIPKERHDVNVEGGKPACRAIGTTWANVIDRSTGREESCFVIILSTTICLLRDGNWEGSLMPLDDIFVPSLTFDMQNLEAVAVGFGFQYLVLDFGEGMGQVNLILRDPNLTLRLIGHLREAVDDNVVFFVAPWPEEAPLKQLLATGRQRSDSTGSTLSSRRRTESVGLGDNDSQAPTMSSIASETPDRSMNSSTLGSPSHQTTEETVDEELKGYYCVFAAALASSSTTADDQQTADNVAPVKKPKRPKGKSFISRLIRYDDEDSVDLGATQTIPTFATTSETQSGSNIESLNATKTIDMSNTFPLRQIVAPGTETANVDWERVSLLLSGDGKELIFIQEEHQTWPYKVSKSSYASVLQVVSTESISYIEVTPPFSVFPLLAVMTFNTPNGAEHVMLCFQTRSSLEHFLRTLDQCYKKVCGGTSLMQIQLRTASYGHEDNSPLTLMKMLLKGSSRRAGGGAFAQQRHQHNQSLGDLGELSAQTSLFVTSQHTD